ncbi:HepT-like ribonuclease domain-containing protein [Bacteroides sp.]|uniref:HepT-like ribonuclease domain-containing protein n=1 Tax=Bacteroides sp. TaxID=29523 RepID=UPI0025C23C42|nr:HepT-like ribonuclease domain-containing protein [Bacteroides sp.]
MQSISNEQVADMLRFVERQTVFVLETTADVKTYHDFLTSVSGMVLFNSTCMCLQTIGETIRKVDDITAGNLFILYPSTPWKKVIGMRNFISHEYLIHRPGSDICYCQDTSCPFTDRPPSCAC